MFASDTIFIAESFYTKKMSIFERLRFMNEEESIVQLFVHSLKIKQEFQMQKKVMLMKVYCTFFFFLRHIDTSPTSLTHPSHNCSNNLVKWLSTSVFSLIQVFMTSQ